MQNQYKTPEGQKLLQEHQKISLRKWSMVRCHSCGTKYDIRLVEWTNFSTKCPKCGKTQDG